MGVGPEVCELCYCYTCSHVLDLHLIVKRLGCNPEGYWTLLFSADSNLLLCSLVIIPSGMLAYNNCVMFLWVRPIAQQVGCL